MSTTEIISILRSRGLNPKQSGNERWTARCPAHDDKSPSLSIAATSSGTTLVHCFAGCDFDDICAQIGVDPKELFGGTERLRLRQCDRVDHKASQLGQSNPPTRTQNAFTAWPELEGGTPEDWERLAQLRGLPISGIELASTFGVLRFGDHAFHGYGSARVWAVRDDANRCLQLRKLDGEKCRWLAFGEPKEAKSYTWPRSDAHWPVGLSNLRGDTPCVLLTEGGPDLLAAFAILAVEDRLASVIPCSMLGSCCSIAPDALALLGGCHVRIIPHVDKSGSTAESKWANQLIEAGASVDTFELADEMDVGKDLNDFVRSTPADRWKAVLQ